MTKGLEGLQGVSAAMCEVRITLKASLDVDFIMDFISRIYKTEPTRPHTHKVGWLKRIVNFSTLSANIT